MSSIGSEKLTARQTDRLTLELPLDGGVDCVLQALGVPGPCGDVAWVGHRRETCTSSLCLSSSQFKFKMCTDVSGLLWDGSYMQGMQVTEESKTKTKRREKKGRVQTRALDESGGTHSSYNCRVERILSNSLSAHNCLPYDTITAIENFPRKHRRAETILIVDWVQLRCDHFVGGMYWNGVSTRQTFTALFRAQRLYSTFLNGRILRSWQIGSSPIEFKMTVSSWRAFLVLFGGGTVKCSLGK